MFKTVLIHKYDRVARNLSEHVNLEMRLHENRVELIAVAQNFGSVKFGMIFDLEKPYSAMNY